MIVVTSTKTKFGDLNKSDYVNNNNDGKNLINYFSSFNLIAVFFFVVAECALQESDHPLEILQRWGSGRLFLRYTVLSTNGK